MRDPLSRCFSSLPSSTDSWFLRVRENLRQLFTAAPLSPSSSNGAPIHLLEHEGSPRIIRAQTVSLLTHAAMIAVLAFAAMHIYKSAKPSGADVTTVQSHLKFPRSLLARDNGLRPDEGTGSGGGRTPIPTTAGNLVPVSSIQLLKPSLPVKQEAQILVPPTILDLSAAPVLTFVDKIGLLWMHGDTNSPGPGDSNTIGSSRGNTMGDSEKDGPGGRGSSSGKYSAGVTWPKCAYCGSEQYAHLGHVTPAEYFPEELPRPPGPSFSLSPMVLPRLLPIVFESPGPGEFVSPCIHSRPILSTKVSTGAADASNIVGGTTICASCLTGREGFSN